MEYPDINIIAGTLNEAATSLVTDLEWVRDDQDLSEANFKVRHGRRQVPYIVEFKRDKYVDPEGWQVAFWTPWEPDRQFAQTDYGNSTIVLSHVYTAIAQFLERRKPAVLFFFAAFMDKRRVAVYNRMLARMTSGDYVRIKAPMSWGRGSTGVIFAIARKDSVWVD